MKSQKYFENSREIASREEYPIMEIDNGGGREIVDTEYRINEGNGLKHIIAIALFGCVILGGYLSLSSGNTAGKKVLVKGKTTKKHVGIIDRTCSEIESIINKITEVDEVGRILEVKSFAKGQLENTKGLYTDDGRFFDWRAARGEISGEQAENNFWEYTLGSKFESKDDEKTNIEKNRREIEEYRSLAKRGGR